METKLVETWAAVLLAAQDSAGALDPLTQAHPALSVDEAYAIAVALLRLREARGEVQAGWKIGFTNRTIWDEYDVHAPIWGPMYRGSIGAATGGVTEWRVSHLHEPRIEAEIAFRFASAPQPGMDEAALLDCIDAVSHGFEIVQSCFPGWRFRPVDTMACGALHGNFVHGPWADVTADNRADWMLRLSDFTITLRGGDGIDDTGFARNVLDGPLSALRHFVDGLAQQPHGRAVLAGDVVTTGTVARAFPVAAGENWSTEVTGLPLPGLSVHLV